MKLSSIKLLLFFVFHQLFLVSIIVGADNVQHVDGNGSVNLGEFNNGTVGHFDDHELFGIGHHLMAEEMNDAAAEDVNQNVHFVKPGKVNLTLQYPELTFQVCTNCTGNVHICYESSGPNRTLKGDCRESSQCSLQIYGQRDNRDEPVSLYFGPLAAAYPKLSPPVCDTIKITGTSSVFKSAIIDNCKPKFENGMIRLDIIKADGRSCFVQALNANVKHPEIITTPSPPQTSVKPRNSTETSKSGTSESSFPWWVILIICVVLLAVGIGIGIAVYFWCKKRRSTKASPTEVTSQPPLVVVTTNNAIELSTVAKTIQAPPKPDPIVAAAKLEPSQSKEPEKPEATLSYEPTAKKPIEDKKKQKAPEKKKKAAHKNIRANYTVAEREALPFPVSVIEDSFEQNPKYLLDTSGIDTDSERDRRKNAEAQKEFKKKEKGEGRGGDAQKRKKKSSKKRQH